MAGAGGVRLSVFKGRKARLNRVIFKVLCECGPLTIYELRKKIRRLRDFRYTGYSVINRRVHALERGNYLEVVELRRAEKFPYPIHVYRLTVRARLAMLLDRLDLDSFLRTADEAKLEVLLRVFSENGE